MFNITRLILPLVLCLMVGIASAQETKNESTMTNSEIAKQEQIKKLNKAKEEVRKEEKEFLKLEVENINIRLERGDISAEDADKLKNEAAAKRAKNIENRIAIIDNKISLIQRNEDNYSKVDDNEDDFAISIGIDEDAESSWISINGSGIKKPRKYDRRTTSDVVFAIGFNNAIIDGQSLDDSPYKIGGSGFVELGYAWKTRLFNNSNVVRIKYGFSLQWNKLNIKDNQYFVNNNGSIALEEFPLNLDKAKYRTTNLVFPIHFEFGPSRKIDRGSYVRYSTRRQFKIGVGGYGGFNIQTMQKLKYNNESGNNTKDKIKGAYNPSDLIYGLSGYIALGGVAIYCKYDLNPIFKDQPVDQNNISLGVRFDMD
ncbi:MAG: hypothetical protein AAGH46_06280 [Bacteroidota bacterium]